MAPRIELDMRQSAVPDLTAAQIGGFTANLQVPMGESEGREYLSWVNQKNIPTAMANSASYINTFRGQRSEKPQAFDSSGKAPVAGPGLVQAETPTSERTRYVDTSQPGKREKFYPESPILDESIVQRAELDIIQKSARASANPKGVLESYLDSSSNRVKAALNRDAARATVSAVTRNRGDKASYDVVQFDQARDGETFDRIFKITRGLDPQSGGASWGSGANWMTDAQGNRVIKSERPTDFSLSSPAMKEMPKVDPAEYMRLRTVMEKNPEAQTMVKLLDDKVAAELSSFQVAVESKGVNSMDDYLNQIDETFGPMSEVVKPQLLMSIPKSITDAMESKRKITEQVDLAREMSPILAERDATERKAKYDFNLSNSKPAVDAFNASNGPLTTKKIAEIGPDGTQVFRDATDDEMRSLRAQDAIKRLPVGTPLALDNPEQVSTALAAGAITQGQAQAISEVSQDFKPAYEMPKFDEVTDETVGAAMLPVGFESELAARVMESRMDGDTRSYAQIISDNLKPLVDDGSINGQATFDEAFKRVEDSYKGLVKQDAQASVSSFTQANVEAVMKRDSGLADTAKRFTSGESMKSTFRLEAERIMEGGIMPFEVDEAAIALAAKGLGLSPDDVRIYKNLKDQPNVADLMPNIHAAVQGIKLGIGESVGQATVTELDRKRELVRDLADKVKANAFSSVEAARIEKISGVKLDQMAGPADLEKAATAADFIQKNLTVPFGEGQVGVFSDERAATAARNALATSKDKPATIAMIREIYGYDSESDMIGANAGQEAKIFEAISGGGFNQLFDAPVDPATGLGSVESSSAMFTAQAQEGFANAWGKSATTEKDKEGNIKWDEGDAPYPPGMKDSSLASDWARAVQSGDKPAAQMVYANYLIENDVKNERERLKVVQEANASLSGLSLEKPIMLPDGNLDTKEFDRIVRGVTTASGFDDDTLQQAVMIRSSLERSAQEMDDAMKAIKDGGVKRPMGKNVYRDMFNKIDSAINRSPVYQKFSLQPATA